MTDIPEIWQKLADKIATEAKDGLLALGGRLTPGERRLSVRWPASVAEDEFAEEMMAAIQQESAAELMQNILDLARVCECVGTFEGLSVPADPDLDQPISLSELITKNCDPIGDPIIIVSPTALCVLESEDHGFVRDEVGSSVASGLRKIGTHSGYDVYYDVLGHSAAPVVIAYRGWVSYSMDTTVTVCETPGHGFEDFDPDSEEQYFGLTTNMTPRINPLMVRTIGVNAPSLRDPF